MGTNIVDTAARSIGHNLRRQGGIATRLAGRAVNLVTHPNELGNAVGNVADDSGMLKQREDFRFAVEAFSIGFF